MLTTSFYSKFRSPDEISRNWLSFVSFIRRFVCRFYDLLSDVSGAQHKKNTSIRREIQLASVTEQWNHKIRCNRDAIFLRARTTSED